MVLRPEAVRERLLRLEDVVSRLEELRKVEPQILWRSFRDVWAVERGLQLAAEIVLDVGNHILSAHFGVSTQDYEDIITQQKVAEALVAGPDRFGDFASAVRGWLEGRS